MAILKNYDEPIEYSFAVPDLGATWFSNAFFVQLAETEAGGGEGAGVGEVLGRCGFKKPFFKKESFTNNFFTEGKNLD